jgi:hypothetical protein
MLNYNSILQKNNKQEIHDDSVKISWKQDKIK